MGGLAGLDSLSFNEDDFKDDDTGIKKMWTVMTKAKVTLHIFTHLHTALHSFYKPSHALTKP